MGFDWNRTGMHSRDHGNPASRTGQYRVQPAERPRPRDFGRLQVKRLGRQIRAHVKGVVTRNYLSIDRHRLCTRWIGHRVAALCIA